MFLRLNTLLIIEMFHQFYYISNEFSTIRSPQLADGCATIDRRYLYKLRLAVSTNNTVFDRVYKYFFMFLQTIFNHVYNLYFLAVST